ncbi:helix-turn-helix domain-containing protein [Cellvibrio fontiphilus]|uniref:Helix-turn-helix domain-containing protein n=1 Tax=Cellvibrio fontiphilus TaxID=1815559 RepID=A0ABV7FIY0_9GAMM
MYSFYKKAFIALVLLVALSAGLLCLGAVKSKQTANLFPLRDANYLWHSAVEPPQPKGKTQVSLRKETDTVEYEFFLDPQQEFPYTHYTIAFMDPVQPQKLVDLTAFDGLSFKVMCDPKNVLLFALFSFDDKVTDINKPITRRVSSTAFSCDHDWTRVNIKFSDLDTPYWWLGRYGFEHSDTGYRLDKTMGFAWVNSLQSPLNVRSAVKITDVQLLGNNWRYLVVTSVLVVFMWVFALVLLLRAYVKVLTLDIREKLRLDQPFMAYKKLSIEPQKDKEKSAVLRFMATEYAKPELSLEIVATALGVNRTKINDILKEELGLTFTSYLNKLRLTEAARLLAENEDANVSEIAYSVGYNNVSYFNKLFKTEYGYAPKTFKALYPIKDCAQE